MMRDLVRHIRAGFTGSGDVPEGGWEEIDLELVRFIDRRFPGLDPSVLLAVFLVSHAYRQGDVCLDLRRWAGVEISPSLGIPAVEEWVQKLRESPVAGPPHSFHPLILDGDRRLYLHRLFQHEQRLVERLLEMSGRRAEVDTDRLRNGLQRLFSGSAADEQRTAAALGVLNRLTVISGGPGTGKTTTVVRLLALLLEQQGDRECSIALAAPTGKAAARLKESIRNAAGDLNCSEEIRREIPSEAVTLHRLLGARRNSGGFRHHRDHPLPADAVIVDEASMIDQSMMTRLTDALMPDTRLILLGDKDQLASVEAGSVLGDICGGDTAEFSPETGALLEQCGIRGSGRRTADPVAPLTDNIVFLTRSYRFSSDSGIAAFAGQVNRGEAEKALQTLKSENFPDLGIRRHGTPEAFHSELEQRTSAWLDAVRSADGPDEVFALFRRSCMLSPHRRGPMGTDTLNRTVERILADRGVVSRYEEWYAGRPVMITRNDHSLNLHNGDIGICLRDGKDLRVWFQTEGGAHSLPAARLSRYETAWAVTVHKSQGSEFDEVLLMLPPEPSRILTRELIYTAATRARRRFQVRGEPEVLDAGIRSVIRRSSGLREYLWNPQR